jgi:ubiquitin-protein ligase E3 C
VFDDLFSPDSMLDVDEKLVGGLPLVLATFQASRPDDCRRLDLVAQGLVRSGIPTLREGPLPSVRLQRLSKILVAALER